MRPEDGRGPRRKRERGKERYIIENDNPAEFS
jgi:hypothetical protein